MGKGIDGQEEETVGRLTGRASTGVVPVCEGGQKEGDIRESWELTARVKHP